MRQAQQRSRCDDCNGSGDLSTPLIERLGAAYLDGSDREALEAQRASFDFIVSTLNVPFDIDPYITMLRPEGQFCFVAAPTQPLTLRAGQLYDYARRRIYGSYVGSRADTTRMLDFAAQHALQPDVEVMPLTELNTASTMPLILESVG